MVKLMKDAVQESKDGNFTLEMTNFVFKIVNQDKTKTSYVYSSISNGYKMQQVTFPGQNQIISSRLRII